MKITSTQVELYEEALKQASKLVQCSNYSQRLELIEKLRSKRLHDIFTLKNPDDDEENNDEKQEEEENKDDNDEKKEEENEKDNEVHNDEKNKEDNNQTNSNIAEDDSKIFLFFFD